MKERALVLGYVDSVALWRVRFGTGEIQLWSWDGKGNLGSCISADVE